MKRFRKAIQKLSDIASSPAALIVTGLILAIPAIFYIYMVFDGPFFDRTMIINTSRGPQTSTGGGICLTLAVLGGFMVYAGIRRTRQRSTQGNSKP